MPEECAFPSLHMYYFGYFNLYTYLSAFFNIILSIFHIIFAIFTSVFYFWCINEIIAL